MIIGKEKINKGCAYSRGAAAPCASLRDFIDLLEREGRLLVVKEAISTLLKMTEIHTWSPAENGPAVLSERPLTGCGKRLDRASDGGVGSSLWTPRKT
jgi:hypothetical protein